MRQVCHFFSATLLPDLVDIPGMNLTWWLRTVSLALKVLPVLPVEFGYQFEAGIVFREVDFFPYVMVALRAMVPSQDLIVVKVLFVIAGVVNDRCSCAAGCDWRSSSPLCHLPALEPVGLLLSEIHTQDDNKRSGGLLVLPRSQSLSVEINKKKIEKIILILEEGESE